MTHSSQTQNKNVNVLIRKGDTSHITLSKEQSPTQEHCLILCFLREEAKRGTG